MAKKKITNMTSEELYDELSNYSDREIVIAVLNMIPNKMAVKLLKSLQDDWGVREYGS